MMTSVSKFFLQKSAFPTVLHLATGFDATSFRRWSKTPLCVGRNIKLDCLQGIIALRSLGTGHENYIESHISSKTPILDSLQLSSDDAFHYLHHVLGIDLAQAKLCRDRFGLLREIILQTHLCLPFQNVSNTFSIPENGRRIPSFADIKRAMINGEGGICYDLNIFTNRVLNALGYDVHLIGAEFLGAKRSHVTNVVCDVEVKGQRHLVEVGAADPTFPPIPLDFEQESPIYQDSFLTYKFNWSPDRKSLQRFHIIDEGDPDIDHGLYEATQPDNWKMVLEIDVESHRDLDYFTRPMMEIFNGKPPPGLEHKRMAVLASIYRKGKFIYIRDNVLYLETGDDCMERRVMRSYEEVFEAYRIYMPMIPQEKVQMGLKAKELVFPQSDEVNSLVSVFPITRNKDAVVHFKPAVSKVGKPVKF